MVFAHIQLWYMLPFNYGICSYLVTAYAHIQLWYMLMYSYGLCSFSVTITFNIMSKFCEQCEQYQNCTLHDVTWN
jgi:hypothetical protein